MIYLFWCLISVSVFVCEFLIEGLLYIYNLYCWWFVFLMMGIVFNCMILKWNVVMMWTDVWWMNNVLNIVYGLMKVIDECMIFWLCFFLWIFKLFMMYIYVIFIGVWLLIC